MRGFRIKRATILVPLRHRSFRLLWLGQVTSDFGDWLDFLALITLIVYRWELGPAALAAMSVTKAIPYIGVSPLAGVWVDRWSRKKVMIVADLGRALVVLGLIWAPNLISILVLIFVKGIFTAFFVPARLASIRSTVPDEDLHAATSLSQLSLQFGKVIGPALSGVLVATIGPRSAFAIDSVTFLVSAVFLSRLPKDFGRVAPETDQAIVAPGRFRREFREGISYIRHKRILTVAIGSMSAGLFMVFIIDSLGALALKALGLGEALFGLAVGSIGLGTAVGAIWLAQAGSRFRPFRTMGTGQLVFGTFVAVMGMAVVLGIRGTGYGWILVYLALGMSAAAVLVSYGYLIQSETPPKLMGRVSSTAEGIETAVQLMAPPVGAALAEQIGVGPVLAGAGAALALVGTAHFVIRVDEGVPGEEEDLEVALDSPDQTAAATAATVTADVTPAATGTSLSSTDALLSALGILNQRGRGSES